MLSYTKQHTFSKSSIQFFENVSISRINYHAPAAVATGVRSVLQVEHTGLLPHWIEPHPSPQYNRETSFNRTTDEAHVSLRDKYQVDIALI